MTYTHLSLFSGIGGLDLAAEWAGFTTVGQCEWAEYQTKVLEKHWPDVPRWRDVHDLSATDFTRRTGLTTVDVVSGGFPCQPHSISGKRGASGDERDLWPEYRRIIREIRPKWVVAENVPGLLSSEDGRFFGNVLRDLAESGYHVSWDSLPAHGIGATFWGERVAIVAASDSFRWNRMDKKQAGQPMLLDPESAKAAWPEQSHLQFHMEWQKPVRSGEPPRNDDGLSEGVERLKCIGNAVVPQQFYPIFLAIHEILQTQEDTKDVD